MFCGRGWIKSDFRQRLAGRGFNVGEGSPALYAVIVGAFFGAGFCIKAMDHAGFQVRHKQLVVGLVEGNIAQTRPGIGTFTQLYLGKHFGCVAGFGVQLVNGSRPASGAPHACHPVGIVCIAMQAEGRSGGQKNVRRCLFVKCYAKNLANFFGG